MSCVEAQPRTDEGAACIRWDWLQPLIAAFCVLASAYLGLEIYAGFRPAQSQAFLVRFRAWMNTHTGQVIIVGSLLPGFWLIAKSI